MSIHNDPRVHEKLCALILGEANEAERAEVERALEQSAELRAERERLERTIALVRDAGLGELALEETTRAELARAAASGSAARADRSIEVAGEEPAQPEPSAPRALAAPETGLAARPSSAGATASSSSAGSSPFGAPQPARTLTAGLPWARLAAGLAAVGLGALAWRAYERGGIGALFHGSGPAPAGGSWTEASRPESDSVARSRLVAPSQPGEISWAGTPNPPPLTFPPEATGPVQEVAEEEPSASTPEGGHFVRSLREPTAATPGDLASATPRQQESGSDNFFLGKGEPAGAAASSSSTDSTYQWRESRAETGTGVAQSPPSPLPIEIPHSASAAQPKLKDEPKLAFEMNRAQDNGSPGPGGPPGPTTGIGGGAGGKFGGRFGSGKSTANAAPTLPSGSPSAGFPGDSRTSGNFGESLGEAMSNDSERLRALGYVGEGDEQRMGLPDADTWLRECVRRPNERPSAMFFRFWGDNAFELAARDPLSTFSIDVDTASYALARRTLEAGRLPVKEQVRTEEFLNYFAPDLPAPTNERLALSLEIAPSRFGGSNGGRDGQQHWLLRAGIRAQEIGQHERAPLALTFVIDTSGSMQQQNRLELVKHALRLLVGQLDAGDQIALVGFSNDARVVLPLTNASRRAEIEQAIHGLSPGGGTNAEAGLKLGYALAAETLRSGATNRVVFLSDGVANIGQTAHEALSAAVTTERARGIYLNTIGVGMGDHNDTLLEQLADQGDGVCNYMDDAQEARRALVDNFVGAFQPVASDVKVQVEFDPAQVSSYRLLGYENRAVADADFRRDSVDAGEIGSGQQVIALYEIVRTLPASVERPLAVLRVRSKGPKGSEDAQVASEQVLGISNRDVRANYGAASAGYRRSALVAQFAEMLRQSVHARGDSLGALLDEARALERELRGQPTGAEFAEFVALVERAAALSLAVQGPQAELERLLDELRHNAYALARIDGLDLPGLQLERERLLQRQRELEQSLRELLDPQRLDVAPR